VLVAVFQWGWGESLLHFKSAHAVTSWLPLFLFVVLFSLSMDYHVFIISRIREAFDKGDDTRSAIAHGIKSSAGVVTAAATVMVATFLVFASLSQVSMKELGVGLAVAVLSYADLSLFTSWATISGPQPVVVTGPAEAGRDASRAAGIPRLRRGAPARPASHGPNADR